MREITNRNGVLSSAITVLSRTVNRVEGESDPEVDLTDALLLQECASVIARSSIYELLSAMKGMKAIGLA